MTLQAKDGLSGMMGIDFEYVQADLGFEGRAFPDIAIRFKGNGTFLESRGSLKRSLKADPMRNRADPRSQVGGAPPTCQGRWAGSTLRIDERAARCRTRPRPEPNSVRA